MSALAGLVADLARFLPPARVEVVPPGLRLASADPKEWVILIRPRTEDEIARVVRAANRHRKPVLIGGGTTQGRPLARLGGAIQLDMTGMERVVEFDDKSLLVRVQTGISIAVLRSRLADWRLQLGWQLYTDAPHTLGGVLSGVPVRWGARYGDVTAAVRSLTFVLPNGGVYREPVAPRRATGPDLGVVAVGTKGHMGIILEATLRVFPEAQSAATMGLSCPVRELPRLVSLFRRGIRPHLLEANASRDGDAQITVCLHGRASEVGHAVGALAEVTGRLPVELLNPALPALGSGLAQTLPWSGFSAFCAAWERDRYRRDFVLDQVTAHHLRVVGGGAKAHREAAAQLTGLPHAAPAASTRHLEGLKARLDPGAVLGRLFE